MLTRVGKYEIVEKIGMGGFGSVYKGRDPFIKRLVAIKTCQSDEEEIKKRFFREAEFAGNLQHRNITTIYDFGVTDEGVPYIVQEFLTGEDLDKKIKRKEPIPLERKVQILVDVCEALGYAHVNGIIHRDIKPSNIRILENGTVKIMDFGIAKSMVSNSTLTQTGITLGTASYLAPEQIRGENVDPRTDLFSLGVLAYEFLTSQKPFTGDHISTVLYKILNEAPPSPTELDSSIPPVLAAAVLHAMEKDRNRRPAGCAEFRAEIAQGIESLEGSAEPPTARAVNPVVDLDETLPPPTPTGGVSASSAAISKAVAAADAAKRAGSTLSSPGQVSIESARLKPDGSAAGTAIGDVKIRPETAHPSGVISAPAGGSSKGLVIALVAVGLVVVLGGAGFYAKRAGLLGGAAAQKELPEPTAVPAVEPTAAPAPRATFPPEPTAGAEPTAAATAAAAGSAVVSANTYSNVSIDGGKKFGILAAKSFGGLKPGRHVAVFEIEGLPPIEKTFEVRAGQSVEVRGEFPARGQIQIEVNYEARDAEIRLDGELLGRGSITRTVKSGPHRIEASLPGFETVTKTVQVPEEDKLPVRLVLPRKSGEAPGAQ